MKGLYIHIPFCVQKCAYCDFVSIPHGEELFRDYVHAVIREAEEYRGEKVDSVFLGGGTPTVLPPKLLEELLQSLQGIFRWSADAECTCESNPGTVTKDKISALLAGGVNRISVGVQSFDDGELKTIGRIHNAQTAYNTVCELHQWGVSNINIDLMTALPGQTPASLQKNLNIAVSLPITHISAYSLILEEGTPLEQAAANGKLTFPDEDTDREMYHFAVRFLEQHGFMQYEISNFAKPGFQCRQNLKYWDCDEYIGLGAAAHSYIGKRRFSNSSNIRQYITGNQREESILTRSDEISEFMMLGLRKTNGVSEQEFQKRFGVSVQTLFPKQTERFIKLGLLTEQNGFYRLTPRGMDVSNSVMCEFMMNL